MVAETTVSEERDSTPVLGVLGTSTSLLFVLVLFAILAFLAFGIVPLSKLGAAPPAPLFRSGEPPAGFTLVEDESFPSRERLRRWARVEGEDADAADDSLAPIQELVTLDYPSRAQARQVFDPQQKPQGFGPPKEEDDTQRLAAWERSKDFAWHSTLRRGEVAWGSWQADYRIERSFRNDGTWRDATRVDLSRGGVNRVLFVLYREGVAADEDSLRALCRLLELGAPAAE